MNKMLVVTGGTKGIGKSIIEKFASEGFDIITCARSEQQLADLKRDIEGSFPGISINFIAVDLSLRTGASSFVDFVNSTDRVPDVLINNTGVFYPGQIQNEEEDVFEKTMDTNVSSAYWVTKGLIHGMIRMKTGHIFNICSTASIQPYPKGASYCISKYALYGMTKVLREELKNMNIRVTAVIPGSTFTPTWDGVDIPEEDFMDPSDVASVIFNAFSLTDRSNVEEIILRPQKGDV